MSATANRQPAKVARVGSTAGYRVVIDTARTTSTTIYAEVTNLNGVSYDVIMPANPQYAGVCTCPDNANRHEVRACKHQRAAREKVAAEQAAAAKSPLQLVPKATKTFRPVTVSGSASGAKYSAFVLAYDSSRTSEPGAGYYSAGNFEGENAARDAARLADKLTKEAAGKP